MKLVLATNNPGKVKEFARILEPLGIEVITQKQAGADLHVEENGETFAENARLKAMAVYRATGLPTVADDSGLCVDALDGKPGVYSARWYGEDTPYAEKNARLIAELEDVPQEKRTARFVAHITCVLSETEVLDCEGRLRGVDRLCAGRRGRLWIRPDFLCGSKELWPDERPGEGRHQPPRQGAGKVISGA